MIACSPKRKKLIDYYTEEGGLFRCLFCDSSFSSQSNVCKHLTTVHKQMVKEKPKEFTVIENQFYHCIDREKSLIDPESVKIIKWKCNHNIPMNAICNDDFRSLVKRPDAVRSRELMTTYQIEIANQMVEKNMKLLKNSYVTLIIDGATIMRQKWLAFCFFAAKNWNYRAHILDVVNFDEAMTKENLTQIIFEIKSKLEENHVHVVGACTDNAKNFVSCFTSTVNESDRDTRLDSMIWVSCACHTAQLILVDLTKKSPEFNKIVNGMKKIQERLRYLQMPKLQEIGLIGYPGIQEHRWNSVQICMQFIIKHIGNDNVKRFLTELELEDDLSHIIDFEKILHPLTEFTTNLEGSFKNQADLFIEYRKLYNAWEIMSDSGYTIAKILLEDLAKRFTKTADIQISEICYYFRRDGIHEFISRFPFFPDYEINDPLKGPMIVKRTTELQRLYRKITQMCNTWKIRSDVVLELFDLITQNEDHTPSLCFPSEHDLWKILGSDFDVMKIKIFTNFINHIKSLPASEAICERIFATMRDSFSDQQKRLKPETLRSMLIVACDELCKTENCS